MFNYSIKKKFHDFSNGPQNSIFHLSEIQMLFKIKNLDSWKLVLFIFFLGFHLTYHSRNCSPAYQSFIRIEHFHFTFQFIESKINFF